MRPILKWITAIWNSETGLLLPFFAIAALLLMFGLAINQAMDGTNLPFDRYVMFVFRSSSNNFSTPIGPAWAQEMARDITALGSFAVLGLVLLVGAGYLFAIRNWKSALFLMCSVLGGAAFNSLLKFGFARPRPDLFAPAARVFTSSFPSDHAALSAVSYMILAAVLGQTKGTRLLQNYLMGVAIVLTLLVGVSRIYLGVHYPTDILAGWCVGSALGHLLLDNHVQAIGRSGPAIFGSVTNGGSRRKLASPIIQNWPDQRSLSPSHPDPLLRIFSAAVFAPSRGGTA